MSDDLTAQRALDAARGRLGRASLGPDLDYTPADLDVLSNVGPADQPETKAYTRATAGKPGVDMLEAG